MRRRRSYAALTDGNLVDRAGAAAEQARLSDAPMVHQERGFCLAAQQPDLVVDPKSRRGAAQRLPSLPAR